MIKMIHVHLLLDHHISDIRNFDYHFKFAAGQLVIHMTNNTKMQIRIIIVGKVAENEAGCKMSRAMSLSLSCAVYLTFSIRIGTFHQDGDEVEGFW
jgi:hypothetical protein